MKRKWKPYKKGDAFKPMPEKPLPPIKDAARVARPSPKPKIKTPKEPVVKSNAPTQARVKELFDYSEDEPQWPLRHAYDKNRMRKGDRAGKKPCNRYCDIKIDRHWHRLHRIVFLWHHGYMPEYVDHKDQDKVNNLIGNLRECTAAQNHANKPLRGNSSSGYAGVYRQINGQWLMRITMNGVLHKRGPFNTEKRAAIAYNRVKFREFGEFAALNPMDKPMRINGVVVSESGRSQKTNENIDKTLFQGVS